ncbi:MAG: hypothetical protein EXS08_04250 [Planctomycetes bacterium]|nr:hypothetical protein [Planctomycetota bacterium]
MSSCTFPVFAAFFLASASWAQTPSPRIREGDALPSGDHVTFVGTNQIDDRGSWLSLVDSDFADVTQDAFLLRDGQVLVREGVNVAGPAGATLDDFVFVASGAGGDYVSILKVQLGVEQIYGLYFDDQLVALQHGAVGAPEVSAAATWGHFQGAWLNGSRALLVLGEISNPDVAGPKEDALVRFQLDGAGAVVSKNVLLTKGQFVPAVNGKVNILGSLATTCALNASGDFLSLVYPTGGPGALLENLDIVLAREGDPAPIAGRSYGLLSKVALNDFGESAFTATLDGTTDTYCIIRNGQKFAQAGDVVPFLPSPLGNGSAAPLSLANSGDLFWRASDATGASATFLRNMEVIVQENVTQIGGALVTRVALDRDAFDASPDGRFWAGRVELQGIGDALVTADFGLVVPVQGCATNTAQLRKASGDALTGQRLTLALDGAQALGALPALLVGTRGIRSSAGCGAATVGGELLVEPASRIATLFGAPWTGAAVPFVIDIPPAAALVDLELFTQGVFAQAGGAPSLRLANALRIQVGAP